MAAHRRKRREPHGIRWRSCTVRRTLGGRSRCYLKRKTAPARGYLLRPSFIGCQLGAGHPVAFTKLPRQHWFHTVRCLGCLQCPNSQMFPLANRLESTPGHNGYLVPSSPPGHRLLSVTESAARSRPMQGSVMPQANLSSGPSLTLIKRPHSITAHPLAVIGD
jgi:hypothetical protein